MIDLHVHILPGMDDGAQTLDESVQMCRMSYQDGVRTIVATPHALNGVYQNDRLGVLRQIDVLRSVLARAGGCNGGSKPISGGQGGISESEGIPLRILPGADVHFCEQIFEQLQTGKITTLADRGRHLFIEFPFHEIPCRAEEALFQLLTRGITPIVSHPERNQGIARRPRRYWEMIRMGCLGQVTAMSLTGGFGGEIRKVADTLLKLRLLHFIASDAHSVQSRPPILSEGVRAAERIVGRREAWNMVTEYPRAVLEGKRLSVSEPLPFH
jgi:protein-tyrosine phosphatase